MGVREAKTMPSHQSQSEKTMLDIKWIRDNAAATRCCA